MWIFFRPSKIKVHLLPFSGLQCTYTVRYRYSLQQKIERGHFTPCTCGLSFRHHCPSVGTKNTISPDPGRSICAKYLCKTWKQCFFLLDSYTLQMLKTLHFELPPWAHLSTTWFQCSYTACICETTACLFLPSSTDNSGQQWLLSMYKTGFYIYPSTLFSVFSFHV